MENRIMTKPENTLTNRYLWSVVIMFVTAVVLLLTNLVFTNEIFASLRLLLISELVILINCIFWICSRRWGIFSIFLALLNSSIGVALLSYLLFMLPRLDQTGPNNQALIMMSFAMWSIDILIIQIPFFVLFIATTKKLRSFLRLRYIVLMLIGMAGPLYCAGIWTINLIHHKITS